MNFNQNIKLKYFNRRQKQEKILNKHSVILLICVLISLEPWINKIIKGISFLIKSKRKNQNFS